MSRSGPRPLAPDAATYRTVLGHFATGVVLVTAIDDGEPVGMACNSFTSVSLEPPLVLFCAAKSSTHVAAHPVVGQVGRELPRRGRAKRSAACSRRRAPTGSRTSRSSPGRTGSPILEDALAFVDCETIAEHDAGDHVIVVGRVVELGYQHEGKPLLFYRGGYGRFES